MIKSLKKFDKVEMYWSTTHDVINIATRKCVATLWTVDAAKKEGEYFAEYVGMDLNGLPRPFGERVGVRGVVAKKAKDGVWDVVVNVKKFNREIFNEAMRSI